MKILLITFIISIISLNANAYYNNNRSNGNHYYNNYMKELERKNEQRSRDIQNSSRDAFNRRFDRSYY